ncbi:MAG: exosortase/archaeosortase family protein [Verrucomicrobiota bacterium JB022]|nr:exosortase/archaeosortase family protein [Verrucomicrobiota bacterium JB022]
MAAEQQKPQPSNKVNWSEAGLGLAAYVFAGLAYGPVASWLFRQTQAHTQLLHAFLVLALAAFLLITERRGRWRPSLQFDRMAQVSLVISLGFVAAATLLGYGLLLLPGLIALTGSLMRFIFGRKSEQIGRGLLSAFAVFATLALLMPLFDWPLRAFAGQGAGWLLSLLGKDTTLQLAKQAGEPILLLRVDGFPFHVAPECNGFGVITASLLLSTLLVIVLRLKWIDRVLLVGLSGVAAYVFNLVRIFIIILLAPVVGMDNYHLMHEIVGTICYYGCLVLIWWFIRGYQKPKPMTEELQAGYDPSPESRRHGSGNSVDGVV